MGGNEYIESNYTEMNCRKINIIKNVVRKIPIIINVLKAGFFNSFNATFAKLCDTALVLNNILHSKQRDRHIPNASQLNERPIFFME